MFGKNLKWSASAAALACCLAAPLQAAEPGDGRAYHVFRTPAEMVRTGRVPLLPAKGQMEYFGGSVFSSVKVVSVIWGPNVNSQTVAQIGGFLAAMANSTYVDQLAQYETNRKGVNGKQGTHQTISRGTYLGQVQITPKDQSHTVTDKAIHKELAYQIAQGVLPAQDLNTLYMIYFPANVTITLDGLTSCQQFGAYHEAVSSKMTQSNIFYGVMPDCGGGFDGAAYVSSHEFGEAMTDNIPTPGSHPKYPQAWNTSDGYEIGDLCEGTEGTLTAGNTSYTVQQLFLNNKNACGSADFHSP